MRYMLPLLLLSCFASYAQFEPMHVPQQPYIRYKTFDHKTVRTFYLSEFDKDKKLPLIVFVQGSGDRSLFMKRPSGNIAPNYGHANLPYLVKGKAKVLIVEKPGVYYLNQADSSQFTFDESFSLQSWTGEVLNAIDRVLQDEQIDASKVIVIGHSEGGLVAASVAHYRPKNISDVILLAGEGPSQLYSLQKFAEDSTFFYDPTSSTSPLDSLQGIWKRILADPASTTKKFWGFTYKRWSTFLQTSVMEQLSDYKGKVAIVQGTADRAVYPESANILYNSLLSKGKNVQLHMIPGADHSFNVNGKDNWDAILTECIDRALR